LKSVVQVQEGIYPAVYAQFHDYLQSCNNAGKVGDWIGHVMFDKVKIKCDMLWNSNSNDMLGFCSGNTDGKIILDEELEKAMSELCESEQSSESSSSMSSKSSSSTLSDPFQKEHATYANQWRFRSVYGVVHNSEFFFNSGSLSGDEILRQWMHVTTCYETIGCKLYGICGDAGGSNASFLKLIREKKLETDHGLK
jgi:hypothetical protein